MALTLRSPQDRSGLLALVVWLLPGSRLKTRLLNALGNDIGPYPLFLDTCNPAHGWGK
ncbi:putative protein OS=Tsukamurella paurometabola (strain ATCC 8368 / DSM / CCUG 35730 /CIP 100753 / JCM 10117 / KCTC 9821 / NBRC 16120 / NCIMB 702349/ NCTC 13040) OX=521096 GN=Tpau_2608 PE=4 SV=1 [Tsukamurella paurometabola]|uniref:Uncharacterized protein n=1 Tax=Tsukamurella paurometabola (strain ATCC 8368 / DSM 20162 / CCUG 35730 / CIP 100753 / JCM 10117 / KCTC 9821 / NBRC 16120 / NCIMB 702349 / NCTC 13040) TaxID=521096 RepID=D5US06_TSUPD|nr:hypothetical protein [Tsukamurella paurometabola]ADG79211.1 hypothetical protein Tpau_2608 [Tsukamurella paurometabola DSM 20162]SUP34564.1 Uncharacterised protein [Tsukamurella paurometabola]